MCSALVLGIRVYGEPQKVGTLRGSLRSSFKDSFIVNPRKLERGFRMIGAGIPSLLP